MASASHGHDGVIRREECATARKRLYHRLSILDGGLVHHVCSFHPAFEFGVGGEGRPLWPSERNLRTYAASIAGWSSGMRV